MSTLDTLEKFTQAWPQAEREELARSFAIGWTALRYQGTGSMEGLEFLYPFLNDSDMRVRRHALQAVGTIFRGTGTESLEKLAYITLNRDLFIRDRAAPIIGQTLVGEGRDTILEVLRPSYTHRNDFVRGQGCTALGIAAQGQGGKDILSLLAERFIDRSPHVSSQAVHGVGLAFAGSGDLDALRPPKSAP